MYKKIIITFLIFLTPIAFIEQQNKNKSSQLSIKQLNCIKNSNLNRLELLFNANKENKIVMKNCWKEEVLVSQKLYYLSNEKIF